MKGSISLLGQRLSVNGKKPWPRDPIPDTLPYTPEEVQIQLRLLFGMFLLYRTADPLSAEADFFWNKAWNMYCALGSKDMLWALPQLQKLILVASVMGVSMPVDVQNKTGLNNWLSN
ncbi:MAG TPA: hypothetical protein PKI59_05325 [Candidatus Cloacimonadota bacterium]|nr:hypothetical protein [Candidatus Cloacimonadota bacterium]